MNIVIDVRKKLFVRFNSVGGGHQVQFIQPNPKNPETIDFTFIDRGVTPPAGEYVGQFKVDDGIWHSPSGHPMATQIDNIFQRLLKVAKENPDLHCYAQFSTVVDKS